MIRQTTSEHDVCLEANSLTYGVEKLPLESCDMVNRLQRWSVSTEGIHIKYIHYAMYA